LSSVYCGASHSIERYWGVDRRSVWFHIVTKPSIITFITTATLTDAGFYSVVKTSLPSFVVSFLFPVNGAMHRAIVSR
jgi:hypothetical protein